jgi:hypothetical protein
MKGLDIFRAEVMLTYPDLSPAKAEVMARQAAQTYVIISMLTNGDPHETLAVVRVLYSGLINLMKSHVLDKQEENRDKETPE